jgi:hypothetical protein
MAQEVVNEEGFLGEVVAVPTVAGQQQMPSIRWTSAMSSFVFRRMCHLISTGVRIDKEFKEVHLNQVAKTLQEFCGNDVTET